MCIQKKTFSIICMMLTFLLFFTGCGNHDKSSQLSSVANQQNTPTGKFVQIDCTPPSVLNAEPISFSQKANGEILLTVLDEENKSLRAFSYLNDNWSEKDNKSVKAFITANNMTKFSGVYDYSDNWWVDFSTDAGELKVYKITRNGDAQEIDISYIHDATEQEDIYISNRQISDNGDVCISIANRNNEVRWVIIDGKTGTVKNTIKPSIADYNPALYGDKLFALDFQSKKENVYDTSTGKILSTHNIPLKKYPACYMVDNESQIAYVDAKGIHKIVPDGNLIQTVIDNPGYAYADPTVSFMSILNDSKSGNYFMTCILAGKLKVFRYSLNKQLPTNSSDKLYIWAFEDNSVVRAASSIFAQKYPECEVNFEFGKTDESGGMTHEDIVRNLNTRLLAGDAPDVLFLDGLSIETLSSQGVLGEINIDINKSDYYENILNSFQSDGKVYAYPAFFQMPVLCSNGTIVDLSKKNTLKELVKLYENDKLIFNNSYKDVFEAFYYSFYSELFPDNKSVNEAAIKDFFNSTKAITDSQHITSEISPWGELGMDNGSGGAVKAQFAPSLMRFSGGNTSYATGLLKNLSEAAVLFKKQRTVEFVPLLNGNYLCRHIASIPANAGNIEMAQNYIRILLSDDSVQLNNVAGGFSVKKGIELNKYGVSKQSGKNGEQPFLCDPTKYDWISLIGSFKNSSNNEVVLYDIVYNQAKKLYSNEIDVDTATLEAMKKLKLFLAERR